MKILVIGLGNFGSTLAIKLSAMGHEVMGVDKERHRTEAVKDLVDTVISMDIAERPALEQLPVNEMDIVIVAIGEHVGNNLVVTSLLQDAGAKITICRAISEPHYSILSRMGVDKIITPETDAAENLINQIINLSVNRSLNINNEYAVCEVKLPERYIGLNVESLNYAKFNLTLLLYRKLKQKKSAGKAEAFQDILPDEFKGEELSTGDLMLVFGRKQDIEKYIRL